jgi:hypothetical protein
MARFTESEVEDAASAWLKNLGGDVLFRVRRLFGTTPATAIVLENSLLASLR